MTTTRIITLCNQKGGVGKTASTGDIAAAAASTGLRVLVIEADPAQGSLSFWVNRVGEEDTPFDLAILSSPSDLGGVRKVAAAYDLVFIDTPGSRAEQDLVTAYLEVSDFIVVVSEVDLMSLAPADRFISELVIPTEKPFRVLLSKADARSPGQETEAREFFAAANQPVFNAAIHLSRSIAYAAQDGVFISTGKSRRPNARKAASEYKQVALELLSTIATL
ncbi:MAG: ParA family protein [Brachybacterium tyrofermentans]